MIYNIMVKLGNCMLYVSIAMLIISLWNNSEKDMALGFLSASLMLREHGNKGKAETCMRSCSKLIKEYKEEIIEFFDKAINEYLK